MTMDSPTEARSGTAPVILTTGSVLALLIFLSVALRQSEAETADASGVPVSTGG